ncbi:MAG TPA: hypothetical protein VK991_08355, partial [Halomonas sp.]|nr:hypothetical protein [Halomonas sp.]
MSRQSPEAWMSRALVLARRGLYTAHPNPRVGCVLVRDGQCVGEGWHARAGEPHAEAHALAAETDTNSLLNIAWNAHQLDLQAHPTVAFAVMRDTVNVVQQVGDQVSIDTVGFVIYVENGKTTRIPIGSPSSHQSI